MQSESRAQSPVKPLRRRIPTTREVWRIAPTERARQALREVEKLVMPALGRPEVYAWNSVGPVRWPGDEAMAARAGVSNKVMASLVRRMTAAGLLKVRRTVLAARPVWYVTPTYWGYLEKCPPVLNEEWSSWLESTRSWGRPRRSGIPLIGPRGTLSMHDRRRGWRTRSRDQALSRTAFPPAVIRGIPDLAPILNMQTSTATYADPPKDLSSLAKREAEVVRDHHPKEKRSSGAAAADWRDWAASNDGRAAPRLRLPEWHRRLRNPRHVPGPYLTPDCDRQFYAEHTQRFDPHRPKAPDLLALSVWDAYAWAFESHLGRWPAQSKYIARKNVLRQSFARAKLGPAEVWDLLEEFGITPWEWADWFMGWVGAANGGEVPPMKIAAVFSREQIEKWGGLCSSQTCSRPDLVAHWLPEHEEQKWRKIEGMIRNSGATLEEALGPLANLPRWYRELRRAEVEAGHDHPADRWPYISTADRLRAVTLRQLNRDARTDAERAARGGAR